MRAPKCRFCGKEHHHPLCDPAREKRFSTPEWKLRSSKKPIISKGELKKLPHGVKEELDEQIEQRKRGRKRAG